MKIFSVFETKIEFWPFILVWILLYNIFSVNLLFLVYFLKNSFHVWSNIACLWIHWTKRVFRHFWFMVFPSFKFKQCVLNWFFVSFILLICIWNFVLLFFGLIFENLNNSFCIRSHKIEFIWPDAHFIVIMMALCMNFFIPF